MNSDGWLFSCRTAVVSRAYSSSECLLFCSDSSHLRLDLSLTVSARWLVLWETRLMCRVRRSFIKGCSLRNSVWGGLIWTELWRLGGRNWVVSKLWRRSSKVLRSTVLYWGWRHSIVASSLVSGYFIKWAISERLSVLAGWSLLRSRIFVTSEDVERGFTSWLVVYLDRWSLSSICSNVHLASHSLVLPKGRSSISLRLTVARLLGLGLHWWCPVLIIRVWVISSRSLSFLTISTIRPENVDRWLSTWWCI